MSSRRLRLIALNLALLPWTAACLAWAATITPEESKEVRALLVTPLKHFRPSPSIRL